MKPIVEQRNSLRTGSESLVRSASDSPSPLHRYNLRSKGPPRYVQFSDTECPICLEDYKAPVIVNCGHSFCSNCIERCIKTGMAEICPICKDKLVRRLFLYNSEYTKQVLTTTNAEHRKSVANVPKAPNGKQSTSKQADRRTVI
ncbi:LON peptidase N-terminal domain and RING finger protein 1-like [Anopheles stephensi]|uniref:LON peptidase N-terminal domain and RING finger protein 1-like n=1 Tax=Anopheles stephensi TaxID=30069 RepID=UPI0016587674|nr:LON peptidase N-terminal domain and RING finger protein 1-like [Anopheles stephensi]